MGKTRSQSIRVIARTSNSSLWTADWCSMGPPCLWFSRWRADIWPVPSLGRSQRKAVWPMFHFTRNCQPLPKGSATVHSCGFQLLSFLVKKSKDKANRARGRLSPATLHPLQGSFPFESSLKCCWGPCWGSWLELLLVGIFPGWMRFTRWAWSPHRASRSRAPVMPDK